MSDVTVIRPPGRLNMPRWSELWASREVLFRLAHRDVIIRYRQTILGAVWVFIQPLVAAGILFVVFAKVAEIPPPGGVSPVLFSLAGALTYYLFTGTLSRAANSMLANYALVAKVFFPRVLVPFSAIVSAIIDFVVGMALIVVLMFFFDANLGWQLVWLPLWILAAIGLGTAVGVFASALMVFYRDVQYVLPWLTQILMFASPVGFAMSADKVQNSEFRWLFEYNPLSWMLEGFRWSLLGTDKPPVWQIVGLAVVCVVLLVGAILYFQRFERDFADII
ncbi:MAG: ABC transporter permease [Micrococcales bacterium]|nr:ABC transporter permease [Micrococcales bacterium]MCL2666086.1 ABC transporter permease [Micrococcales bacterium]